MQHLLPFKDPRQLELPFKRREMTEEERRADFDSFLDGLADQGQELEEGETDPDPQDEVPW